MDEMMVKKLERKSANQSDYQLGELLVNLLV